MHQVSLCMVLVLVVSSSPPRYTYAGFTAVQSYLACPLYRGPGTAEAERFVSVLIWARFRHSWRLARATKPMEIRPAYPLATTAIHTARVQHVPPNTIRNTDNFPGSRQAREDNSACVGEFVRALMIQASPPAGALSVPQGMQNCRRESAMVKGGGAEGQGLLHGAGQPITNPSPTCELLRCASNVYLTAGRKNVRTNRMSKDWHCAEIKSKPKWVGRW